MAVTDGGANNDSKVPCIDNSEGIPSVVLLRGGLVLFIKLLVVAKFWGLLLLIVV